MLVAGVGGQGVVYSTNLIVEAALLAGVEVASSEIHGLAQRSGSVMAGLTFGEKTFGFIEKAGADILLGLELLEAQRCLQLLNKSSKAVIDNRRIFPYSVNAQKMSYPDTDSFINYLNNNIAEVDFITEINDTIDPILRNIYILGRASLLSNFPIEHSFFEQAIEINAKAEFVEETLRAFQLGRDR